MSRQLADSGTAHRFPKGHVPANKGRKMNAGVYAKVSATMFKKGHMPDNTLYDGAESIRKDKNGHRYVYVRISLGKWIPKACAVMATGAWPGSERLQYRFPRRQYAELHT